MPRFNRHDPLSKGFCREQDGLLAAVRLMAEKHLTEVLVLDRNCRITGSFQLDERGLRFSRRARATAS